MFLPLSSDENQVFRLRTLIQISTFYFGILELGNWEICFVRLFFTHFGVYHCSEHLSLEEISQFPSRHRRDQNLFQLHLPHHHITLLPFLFRISNQRRFLIHRNNNWVSCHTIGRCNKCLLTANPGSRSFLQANSFTNLFLSLH